VRLSGAPSTLYYISHPKMVSDHGRMPVLSAMLTLAYACLRDPINMSVYASVDVASTTTAHQVAIAGVLQPAADMVFGPVVLWS